MSMCSRIVIVAVHRIARRHERVEQLLHHIASNDMKVFVQPLANVFEQFTATIHVYQSLLSVN